MSVTTNVTVAFVRNKKSLVLDFWPIIMLLYCYVRRLTKSDHDKKRKQMCIFQQNPTKKCLEREQKVDIGNQILNEAHLPFCDKKPYVSLLVQIV